MLNPGDPIPVDFTATINTGTKSYRGGSFLIDAGPQGWLRRSLR
jgi:hypothetical protein